jgi:hypothetical protein
MSTDGKVARIVQCFCFERRKGRVPGHQNICQTLRTCKVRVQFPFFAFISTVALAR